MFSAGGENYAAFGRFHKDMARFKVGDDVNFQWEQGPKGRKVTNVIGLGSGGTTPASSGPAPEAQVGPSNPKPFNGDFNIGMAVSYAKDLVAANRDLSAAEAVAIIKDIHKEFTKPSDDAAKESL